MLEENIDWLTHTPFLIKERGFFYYRLGGTRSSSMTRSISRILCSPTPCRFAQDATNSSSVYKLSSLA